MSIHSTNKIESDLTAHRLENPLINWPWNKCSFSHPFCFDSPFVPFFSLPVLTLAATGLPLLHQLLHLGASLISSHSHWYAQSSSFKIGQANFLSSQGFSCQTYCNLHELPYCPSSSLSLFSFSLSLLFPLSVSWSDSFTSGTQKRGGYIERATWEVNGSKGDNQLHQQLCIRCTVGQRL